MNTSGRLGKLLRNPFRRDDFPSGTYVAGIGVVGGTGVGTFWIHLLHLVTRSESLYTRVLGTIVPMVLSVGLVAVAAWIHRNQSETIVVRTGAWCFVGTVVLVGVSVVSIVYQQSKGVLIVDPLFVVTNHATVGAILGSLVGVYDGQRRKRGRDLDAERTRARQLHDQLTILNRVLRHDIRNSVNVILGNAELVRQGSVDPESATAAITAKARELQEISAQVSQFESFLDSRSMTVSRIDVAPILRAKTRRLAEDHPGIELETDIPDTVEVRTVPLIGVALEELLENAVEHNDAAAPRVEVSVASRSTRLQTDGGERDGVCLRVCDNGPGIDDAELDVLERGHETALEHTSGLGLWLVHWIVDVSDGYVAFEANRPRGSTVEVVLPAA